MWIRIMHICSPMPLIDIFGYFTHLPQQVVGLVGTLILPWFIKPKFINDHVFNFIQETGYVFYLQGQYSLVNMHAEQGSHYP